MTYKQIETSREIRQWLKGVILPIIAGVLYLELKYPNLKYQIKDRFSFKKDKKEGK